MSKVITSNPLLGFSPTNQKNLFQEEDLLARNTRKLKGKEEDNIIHTRDSLQATNFGREEGLSNKYMVTWETSNARNQKTSMEEEYECPEWKRSMVNMNVLNSY